ncbi:GtrA family protein [Candidatus Synechococcus spongiarum]|uniref:GtrA family protein n=1 Tax=Candidatus Synechococcus spongiarum TaxID=431041 RepID=UPI0004706592|nr:GtrA family protein [Candidatus Synechococcus spongiarum]
MGKAVVRDQVVSLLGRFTGGLAARPVISFALVRLSGTVVHSNLFLILRAWGWSFLRSQSVAVAAGASSNYWGNNRLAFRSRRLRGKALFLDLIKFLLVYSPGLVANILHLRQHEPPGAGDRGAGGWHCGGLHLEVHGILPLCMEGL